MAESTCVHHQKPCCGVTIAADVESHVRPATDGRPKASLKGNYRRAKIVAK